MDFLQQKESVLQSQSDGKRARIEQVKGMLESQGVQGTVVDRYVQKQLAWSEAREKWDTVRSEASGKYSSLFSFS